jgi:hypothetical protein
MQEAEIFAGALCAITGSGGGVIFKLTGIVCWLFDAIGSLMVIVAE